MRQRSNVRSELTTFRSLAIGILLLSVNLPAAARDSFVTRSETKLFLYRAS